VEISFILRFSTDSVEITRGRESGENGLDSGTIFEAIDEFQAGPDLIDCADLYVYETGS
jgi:hypothetical protein